MNFKSNFLSHWVAGLVGAALVFGVGLALHSSRDAENPQNHDSWLSRALTRSSYDWSFDLSRSMRPDLAGSDVVIIYMDVDSYTDLHQPFNAPWDRSLHARLLRRLKDDGAQAVVMDIVFSDPGPDPASDQMLADAIAANGKVILAQDINNVEPYNANQFKLDVRTPTPLFEPFETNAAAVGIDGLQPDGDLLVRQHVHSFGQGMPSSLSWSAAQKTGLKLAQDPARQEDERYVYYYGPPETVRHVSYKQAYDGDLPAGFFRNKIVFIGARPMTTAFSERRDEMRNPYSTRGVEKRFVLMPMVEVHATELLNLLRGDWLTRPSGAGEVGILALAAVVFGFGLIWLQPRTATLTAVLGAVTVTAIAQALFAEQHIWFPWLIIVVVQVPTALTYAIVVRSLEWYVQRRKLEEERRRAQARIREQAALLDKAQDAILVHDLEWRAQYWNPSAERLYGWSFDEVKTRNLRTEVFKADDAKLLDALQVALRSGEWTGELRQNNREGKLLTLQSRWTLVRDEAGRPNSVLVINTDVTEQKNLEAQFLRTQRMESIGTLAGGIAHDLNNVLSPILMGVELMKMKAQDEHSLKMLNTMSSSAKRGSDMVKQVLAFARGVAGDRTVLQISHLIREMQKIVKETFPKTIEFNTIVEDIQPILGDATQVHQIILNLCVNARDAMPNGGGITIEAKNVRLSEEQARKFTGARPINYVVLSVTDTGTGIPPEIIDKIFEPFFTTKEIGKGTGLGLSTVISIIKSHGGFLDLQSEVGKGTAFNVYLPAADAPVPPPAAATPPEALWGKGETIMIVDDEPAVLELTKNILAHYGYKVVTAIHGADALALYSQYKDKIKAVIVDMMMPVMDEPACIRALRVEQPNLQCIAISGLMQSEKLKEQLGGVEVPFVSKPYTTENLLQQLRQAVTRTATA